MDRITHSLAAYTTLTAEAEPDVRREVARRVLDSAGCALGAMDYAGPVAARAFAASRPHDAGSIVWGSAVRAHTEAATLANGAALRYLDLNDSYFALESCHPSDVFAGLFAIADRGGCTGRQLLDAAAVGYEVAVSLSDAFSVRAHGWDHVNVTGIAACCAAARLQRLTLQQTAEALALTIIPHAAMRQTRLGHLGMWKGFAAADAVRHAVYACDLAVAGVEGPSDVFTGGFGFINQMLGGVLPNEGGLHSLFEQLPPRRIFETHIKVWPVGYVAQSAVEAASLLRGKIAGVPIESVRIDTFQAAVDMMGSPEKWRPTSRETADHSLPYVVAEMLRYGEVDMAAFEPNHFATDETHGFLERVQVRVDPEFTARYADEFPARITVLTADGHEYVSETDVASGHARRPLSDSDLLNKFQRMAAPAIGDRSAETLSQTVLALDRLPDASAVNAAMACH